MEAELHDFKLDASLFKLEFASETPQQSNGIDCGIFSMAIAKYLICGYPLDFEQDDIPSLRWRICGELLDLAEETRK